MKRAPNAKISWKLLDDRETVYEILRRHNPCHQLELEAAYALLETGMEERPLHALERAHVVLVAIGAISDSVDRDE